MSGFSEDETILNHLLYLQYEKRAELFVLLTEACKLGNHYFNTSNGIVSRVKDNMYGVFACHSAQDHIQAGQQFELRETYCSLVLASDVPRSFHDVSQTEVSSHPCYRKFKLERYIGAPIKINKTSVGTVNFSSAESSDQPFSVYQEVFIQAMADWVAQAIKLKREEFEMLTPR